jgi:hypothetical protein
LEIANLSSSPQGAGGKRHLRGRGRKELGRERKENCTGVNIKEFSSIFPLLKSGVHLVTTEPNNWFHFISGARSMTLKEWEKISWEGGMGSRESGEGVLTLP